MKSIKLVGVWRPVMGVAIVGAMALGVSALAAPRTTDDAARGNSITTNSAGPSSAEAAAPALQRPISDFVDAQGTFCIDDGGGGCFLFVPPIANFLGWTDPVSFLGAAVDYAGLADKWITEASGGAVSFGTTFSGKITERLLPDGRAAVHVRLHTQNALSWAIECDPNISCDFGVDPTIFGNRAPDVLGGEAASLGSSLLTVKFINTAPGDPLPDLLQLFNAPLPGQEGSQIKFVANASGTLADGTPATLHVTQIGLLDNPGQGPFFFPAETVAIEVDD